MRVIWLAAAVAVWAGPVLAHDFWLQPRSYKPAEGVADPTTIYVGHGPDREKWGADLRRVIVLRSIGPKGVVDRQAALRAAGRGNDANHSFTGAGAHVLVMQTNHAESSLPAIRFNDFLTVEGLTPVLEHRARTRKTEADGREIYNRQAKALVQVGPVTDAAQPWVTQPVGLQLEVVPERNPYVKGADNRLPFRILYLGKPLPGALVKLTNLAFDARPLATARSDKDGRVVFEVPRTGAWLVNVIWSRPITGNRKADFETTFSSLTFGYQ